MMNKLFAKFIIKRRNLVVNEADVVKVLSAIGQHKGTFNKINRNMTIMNCGWEDSTKWFVRFDASDKTWNSIRDELKVVRVWDVTNIPKDSNGKVYSTD